MFVFLDIVKLKKGEWDSDEKRLAERDAFVVAGFPGTMMAHGTDRETSEKMDAIRRHKLNGTKNKEMLRELCEYFGADMKKSEVSGRGNYRYAFMRY